MFVILHNMSLEKASMSSGALARTKPPAARFVWAAMLAASTSWNACDEYSLCLVACILSACVEFFYQMCGENIVRHKICVFFWPYLTNRSQINLGTRVMPSRCYSLRQLSGSFRSFRLVCVLLPEAVGGGNWGREQNTTRLS